MKIINRIIVGTCALFMAAASWAHHSYAPYEIDNPVDLPGVVKSFRFIAPHPKLLLVDAQGLEWDIEVPIMFWRNADYAPDAIKAGDEVIVKGFPARNGSAKMALAGFEVAGTYYPVHENISQRTAVEAADRIAAGEDIEAVLEDYPEPEAGTFFEGDPSEVDFGGMGMGGMGGIGMAGADDATADAGGMGGGMGMAGPDTATADAGGMGGMGMAGADVAADAGAMGGMGMAGADVAANVAGAMGAAAPEITANDAGTNNSLKFFIIFFLIILSGFYFYMKKIKK